MLAPRVYTETFAERFDTFHHLDQDKSYKIRLLMIQKGWRMFLDSPLFGAGAGTFTKDAVKLDLDKEMRYGSQKHFNKKSPHNPYITLLAETGLAGCRPLEFYYCFWWRKATKRRLFYPGVRKSGPWEFMWAS